MSFEVQGTLNKKFDTTQVTDSFKKREFVLEIEDGAYSQFIKFQLIQDRCSLLDSYNEGDVVKVYFNLKGRPYNNRQGGVTYFTNLDAWKVEGGASAASTPPAGADAFPSADDIPPETSNDDNDDLPF